MSDGTIINWDDEISKLELEAAAIAGALPDVTRLDALIWLEERLRLWIDNPRMIATTLTTWNDFYRKLIVETA